VSGPQNTHSTDRDWRATGIIRRGFARINANLKDRTAIQFSALILIRVFRVIRGQESKGPPISFDWKPQTGRDAEIRTRGLTHPKGARYQAAPRPVKVALSISAKTS
jgi:hypothetical protein